MYLSAERVSLVNQTITETFEQTCISWQAIPHWDTGDPGQSRVRDDVVDTPGFVEVLLYHEDFQVTLVQTSAPTPDSLIAEVILATTKLARTVDEIVLLWLGAVAQGNYPIEFLAKSANELLAALIDARAKVEDEGYRAPSCLITNTQGLKYLSALDFGYPITEALLDSAHVNSLHRTSLYDFDAGEVDETGNPTGVDKPATIMVMLGRRQLIPHGGAPDASPGEEPVDLAVSVCPSLEVIGETADSKLELSIRTRFALRVKDPKPLVVLYGMPVAVAP